MSGYISENGQIHTTSGWCRPQTPLSAQTFHEKALFFFKLNTIKYQSAAAWVLK
jgi:hypothetical protein